MEVLTGSIPFSWEAGFTLEIPDEPRPDGGWPLLVGLHGLGQDGLRFAAQLRGLRPGGYARLWPDAPYPVEVREGDERVVGRTWYHYDGDQGRFLAGLSQARDHLDRVCRDAVSRGINGTRMVLMGYSQGGYLAGWCGLTQPARWCGLAVLSARLKVEAVDLLLPAQTKLPVLALHGHRDRVVRVEDARASAERARTAGVSVEFETFEGGHRLSEAAGLRVDQFVRRALDLGE